MAVSPGLASMAKDFGVKSRAEVQTDSFLWIQQGSANDLAQVDKIAGATNESDLRTTYMGQGRNFMLLGLMGLSRRKGASWFALKASV